MLRFFMLLLWLCALFACSGNGAKECVFFDFESDSELDRLHWSCHALYQLTNEHATHGRKCLRLELYPANYPGLTPMLGKNDWRGYEAFCLDIYNPEETEIRITVRMDDRKEYPDYKDRYNKSFTLKPGPNL